MHEGDEIRKAREARGLSQTDLSRLLAIDAGREARDGPGRNQVYRWERGERRPAKWRPHIELVLDIRLSGYGGHRSPPAGIPRDEGTVPVDRRQLIGAGAVAGAALTVPDAVATGRRIGRSDVDHFRQRIADLRRLDDFSGGASVYPLVVDEIGKLSSLATRASYSEDVGRRLLSTLGELFQFAAWTAFDAGRIHPARQLAQRAAHAANQAGDRTLGATALSELSYLTASTDKPGEGVAMARASLANAPADLLPVVRVVLADRLAWACARTGDAGGVDRALGLSDDAHDRRDLAAAAEPDTVYWINRDESQIMAGRCWAELRRPDKAVPVLETLTAPYDDTHAREVSLYSSWLASAYLDAKDVDQAVVSATRAVGLSRATASPRTDAMLRDMLAAFEPHRHVQEVRELLTAAPL